MTTKDNQHVVNTYLALSHYAKDFKERLVLIGNEIECLDRHVNESDSNLNQVAF